MSLLSLLAQPVELFQPTYSLDSYRSQVVTFPPTPSHTFIGRKQILGAQVDNDINPGEQVLRRQWQLYLPAEASIMTQHDRVRVDGIWFNVSSVYNVPHPNGYVHHVEVVIVEYNETVPR